MSKGEHGRRHILLLLLLILICLPADSSAFKNIEFLFQVGPDIGAEQPVAIKYPADIATSKEGGFYVTDAGNNRVLAFDSEGRLAFLFGEKGKKTGQLRNPWGIAVSGAGNIYVSDSGNDRIQVFSREGRFLFSFGSSGSGRGNLSRPKGIAIDSQRRVIVADSGNRSLCFFSIDGIFLGRFGIKGIDTVQFKSPLDIDVDRRDNIYVADEKGETIYVFSHDMSLLNTYQRKDKEDKGFGIPSGITVDTFGDIFYSDSRDDKIQQISAGGTAPIPFGSRGKGRAQFDGLRSLHYDGKNHRLYIADSSNRRIQAFNIGITSDAVPSPPAADRIVFEQQANIPFSASDMALLKGGRISILDTKEKKVTIVGSDGEVEIEFGRDEKGRTLIGAPESVAYAQNNLLYISDSRNEKVHVFSESGEKQFEFGGRGNNNGQFSDVKGIASYGDIIAVADSGNDRIQIFTMDGLFLRNFGRSGKLPGELRGPADVAVNSRGEVLVADTGNDRIQVFDMEGNVTMVFEGGGNARDRLYRPTSLFTDSDDRIYVLDGKKGDRVHCFNTRGESLYIIGSYGSGRGQFNRARNIYVESERGVNIYVADSGNDRIQVVKVRQAPSTPAGLKVAGDEKGSTITWQKNEERFTRFYRVYSKRTGGGYALLSETEENSFYAAYPLEKGEYIFAVSSVSFSGLESPLSPHVKDEFRLGYDKYLNEDFDGAIKNLKLIVEKDKTDERALLYLGEAYLGLKDYASAGRIFRDLSESRKMGEQARIRLGETLFLSGELDGALEAFIKVVSDNPKQSRARTYMGEIYYRKGLFQPALETLKGVIDDGVRDARTYELLGLIYIRSKVFNKAKESLQAALEIEPGSASLHKTLAGIYEAGGETGKAVEEYGRAITSDPKGVDTYISLGQLYLNENRVDEAENVSMAALELAPDNSDAIRLKGQIYLARGNYEDAVIAFRKVLSVNGEDMSALLEISRALVEIGQIEEGIKYLQKLSTLNPKDTRAMLALGNLKKRGGDSGGALDAYKSCISIDPDHAACHREAATILLEARELEKGSVHLSEVIRVRPDDSEARIILAKVLIDLDKVGEAIFHLEEAAMLDGKNGETRHLLGTLYMKNRQMTKALKNLRAAVSLSSKTAAYHNSLGLAYMDKVMLDDAIDAFKKAYSIESSDVFRQNLNRAYERKKELLAAAQEAPPIEISDIQLDKIFASAYKYYEDNPIGIIIINNNSDDVFTNVKVGFNVKKYMDFPSEELIEVIKPHERVELKVKPTFNNNLLNITEDTSVQTEIKVEYFHQKKPFSLKRTHSFTIYNRNAMTWSQKEMAAAFITPKDTPVVDFARGIIQMFHNRYELPDENLGKAIRIFDALGVLGLVYLADPNNPYSKVSMEYGSIDAIQFPRDTLRHKSGDCDDLVTLYAALLENVGVETAMLDIPGHLFMAFKTSTPAGEGYRITDSKDLYLERDGYVWIPLEATMVGKTFTEAWYEGGKEVKNSGENLKFIHTHTAWESFKPVTLEETQGVTLPDKEKIAALLDKDLRLQKRKSVEKLAEGYMKALGKDPDDYSARLNLGIIYARNGYRDDAMREFMKILEYRPDDPSALNSIGNLLLEEGNYVEALEKYEKAEAADSADPGIKMNMSLLYYRTGNLEDARKKFSEAERLSAEDSSKFKLLRSLLFD